MKTITQMAALTGISVRTLRYYDAIGLLKPTGLTEGGYRLYDEDAVKPRGNPLGSPFGGAGKNLRFLTERAYLRYPTAFESAWLETVPH